MNLIGKQVYLKFGAFHGKTGTVMSEVHINGSDRYMIKLENGLIIPKKVKNVLVLGEVQHSDNYKKK